MKKLHRDDLYGWSQFDENRNIDFHSVLWVRAGGNIVVDPLPLSDHDWHHMQELGPVNRVVITNSDHTRDGASLARKTGAKVLGPAAEREDFPIACDQWLSDGDDVVPGLRALAMQGSKTPGEIALVLEETTLITGDLVRAHEGGRLCLIPDAKLKDKGQAIASLRRLAIEHTFEAVLTGDGWPLFRQGAAALRELVGHIETNE